MLTIAQYRLAIDGDDFERHYWGQFIKNQFPSYEAFWMKFVVPLTNRPYDINFKTDAELKKINKTKADLCVAQLNYSVLTHLSRCFEVLRILRDSTGMEQADLLLEGMTRLVGAQDNAFELLERLNRSCCYDPFDKNSSKLARERWQQDKKHPLQDLRSYRNALVHGLLLPRIIDGSRLCMPGIGKENLYLDWRLITELSSELEEYKKDFISVLNILESAWNKTIMYLENNWKNL